MISGDIKDNCDLKKLILVFVHLDLEQIWMW